MDEKAEKIIQKITEETDKNKEQILNEIEELQEKLGGFVTEEGAANILAKNNGVSIERDEPDVNKLLIEDISEGMSNIDIVGRVTRAFEPTTFQRKDGSKGKVANIVLKDKTGEIKTVLWGKMTKLITEGELERGVPVRFEKVYVRDGQDGSNEIHVNARTEVEPYTDDERAEDLPQVSDTKTKLAELNPESEYVDVIGRVTSVSEPKEFERADKSTGKVANIRIMDNSGRTRVSLWDDKTEIAESLEEGDSVLIENATVKEGYKDSIELSVNRRSRVVENPQTEESNQLPEFEKKKLKIEDIEPDLPTVDLAARVQRTTSPNEFTREDGSSGRVMNVILGDETGTIRASFWSDMVDTGKKLSSGDILLIENANSSKGMRDQPEIRVNQRTNLEINPENLEIEEPESEMVRISDIEPGLDSIEIVGRVIDKSEINEFEKDEGETGKVGSVNIGDESGTIRATLWEEKSKIIEKLEKGDIIKIKNAYSVAGNYGGPEIQVEERGEISKNPQIEKELPPVDEINENVSDLSRVEVEEAEEGSQIKIRGTIVKIFKRKPIFNVCPNCGRNLGKEDSENVCENCEETVTPDHRAVVNLIVDDGTDSIRVVAFAELAEKILGKTAEEISNSLTGGLETSEIYEDIEAEGKEIIAGGTVQKDDYFDQLELRAQEIEFPNPLEETKRILEELETEPENI